MKTFTLISLAAIVNAATVQAAISLQHEHAGDLIKSVHQGYYEWLSSGVINNGTPSGQNYSWDGETNYISYPKKTTNKTDVAILYLTDIFGNSLVNNRLLADSLARAGYFVVMPDLFRGDPVPADALSGGSPGFNMTAWSARHPQAQIETIINTTISTIRNHFNSSKVAAVGYCFGGRYVARYLAPGKGIDAGFAAHPSGTQASEWQAVSKPISIAFGQLDNSNTPQNRSNIESIFISSNKTFQTSLYANAEHGFAVRTNLTDKKKAFAQESAYFQAVRWFDYWVKEE